MTPVQVCNLALSEIGSKVFLNSFGDTSPQAIVANINYIPKTQSLLRAANWDFARGQITLTQWKAAIVNGVTSTNPPPQPWLFSYIYPPDCLKARFLLPTQITAPGGVPLTTNASPVSFVGPAPTGIPFVRGTDKDQNGNPIQVLLTNLCNAQLVYTRDLSMVPDEWDPLFLAGETAYLASIFINALARNAAQYQQQVAQAKAVLDEARMANGNEGIGSVDHRPDWMQARRIGGYWGGWNGPGGGQFGYGGAALGGWDSLSFDNLRY